MSGDDNKRAVAEFVERCQNQHDLAFADEAFHPKFVNHYRPEGRALPETDRPARGFQAFYGALLQGFPDATVEIDEQFAERDLVATRKTFRGTHLGELWDLPPTGNRALDVDGHQRAPAADAPVDRERVTVTLPETRYVKNTEGNEFDIN